MIRAEKKISIGKKRPRWRGIDTILTITSTLSGRTREFQYYLPNRSHFYSTMWRGNWYKWESSLVASKVPLKLEYRKNIEKRYLVSSPGPRTAHVSHEPKYRSGFWETCNTLMFSVHLVTHQSEQPELWKKFYRRSRIKNLFRISSSRIDNLLQNGRVK